MFVTCFTAFASHPLHGTRPRWCRNTPQRAAPAMCVILMIIMLPKNMFQALTWPAMVVYTYALVPACEARNLQVAGGRTLWLSHVRCRDAQHFFVVPKGKVFGHAQRPACNARMLCAVCPALGTPPCFSMFHHAHFAHAVLCIGVPVGHKFWKAWPS